MVRVASYFAMTLGAFVFWQSMDKVHVWIALHQDEKQERLEKEAEIRRVREELLRQQANQKGVWGDPSSVAGARLVLVFQLWEVMFWHPMMEEKNNVYELHDGWIWVALYLGYRYGGYNGRVMSEIY
ncbi:hypothetical protein LR48_Vigan01g034100 [Vigna angularis]|uniref:Uncharacterized protein n=2 Tax=Phaseolus angularis TaxID=3914 RepID=A0A0L9TJY1_PHAAN|nr:hypothetical protein LR48_Vigan01g034100 [Vigna angularis]